MQTLLLFVWLIALGLFARYFVGWGIGAPWLPARRRDMNDIVELGEITEQDITIDLGSGDGRLLVEAGKLGAHVIGYELNPLLVWWSKRRLKKFGDRAAVYRKNLLDADVSRATLIYIFGIGTFMPAVAEKLKRECQPGTKIVSIAFELPGWNKDAEQGAAIRYIR